MKKLFFTNALFLFAVSFTMAQTLEDAKKHLYYERFETAKADLTAIIAAGNAAPEASYLLGNIYLEQKNIDSARIVLQEKYQELVSQNISKKQNPLVYIGWANVLLDSGMVTEAKQQMEAVLSAGKYKDAEALLAVARANINSKNGDSLWAVELLKKAITRDKKNEVIYTTLGDAYRRLIDGSNASVSYAKALDINPGYAEAMFKDGRIYKSQNNSEIYVDRFKKALLIDSLYTPALYELYYYYYFRDVVTAKTYLNAYLKNADPSPENAYMITDLNYVSKEYQLAIEGAKSIIAAKGDMAEPRMYKLIAYSYAAIGDSTSALSNMDLYFEKQQPTELVAKDFDLKAHLLQKLNPDRAIALEWYKKALEAEKDENEKLSYMVNIAELQNELGNREREAVWREKVFYTKKQPTNLDIYKWGLALYAGKDYEKADSVFTIYEEKYPDQLHGYLWRARINALIDSTMTLGLAVPHYVKLAEVAAEDSVKNKPVLLTAYEYLGAYEANVTKNYIASLDYYDKVLQLNPANGDAIKNTEILKKWIEAGKGEDD